MMRSLSIARSMWTAATRAAIGGAVALALSYWQRGREQGAGVRWIAR